MLGRHWLPVFAVAGLIFTASAAISADAPNAQGVATPSPAIENQSAKTSNTEPQPAPIPTIPVQVIQSPADAEHAQEREAKSDKHDAEDLDAQIRAAKAAEEQVSPAWVAAVLTLIGTLLLVWNLREARKANQIARDAIAQSERHAQQQLRAYVLIEEVSASVLENGHSPKILIWFKNTGQTPALNVTIRARSAFMEVPLREPLPPVDEIVNVSREPLGPSVRRHNEQTGLSALDIKRIDALKSKKWEIIVYGEIQYDDVFGYDRRTRFRYFTGGELGLRKELAADPEGNDAT